MYYDTLMDIERFQIFKYLILFKKSPAIENKARTKIRYNSVHELYTYLYL